MGHKFDTLLLVWTSHVFRVNWLRLFFSVFCTLIFIVDCSSPLWTKVDWQNHVKSLCLLVYFSLSSYSWSFEVCFASLRIYTCLFPILTSGIRARFNDGVRFSGSIIDDWTRFERCVHLGGVVLAVTFLTVMKILLEKFFQRDSLCWDINFAKEIMERRSKLLKIK